jgi:cytochrome c oxidase cbb3-type subunit 2
MNPRDVVPESNMPAFPWLFENPIDSSVTPKKLATLQALGVPYSQADIDGAAASVEGKKEIDAVVAYLQNLGTVLSEKR